MTETAAEPIGAGGDHLLRYRVLGPVEVIDGGGRVVDVGGSKPRLVLVQLLLNINRMVSTDALVDVVWGEDAPPTARRSMQSHVAKLRAALGGDDGPLRSQPPGYVLTVDESEVDLWRSEAFAREARASLESDPRRALRFARAAGAEWVGDPFADLAGHGPLLPQRQRLNQIRFALLELEIDALMAAGDTSDAVDQLESLVLERPQHEPFWARLMTAYYRLGRQSDALRAFGRASTVLMDELGVGPSPELQRLEVAILTQADDLESGQAAHCPYKGLASYQLDDADLFCGRDDLVVELIEAVRSASFVVVVGSSGAGKSSALRAGLVRAIEAGRIAAVTHAIVITPTVTPMRCIYQVPRSADVVIVDQFEELFTLTDDDAVQREFVRVLLASVNDGTRRAVISLRADFYGDCTKIPELAAVLARRQVVVGAMSERELRTVITQPAQRAGLVVDEELVEAIVAEAADHSGALPLVSHALVETWRRRTDVHLTVDAYREAGSLAGAIARTAENVYGGLTSEQRAQMQRLLLRLVEPGVSAEHTRRRVPYEQLEGSTIDRRVLDVLIEARLLTADGAGVEIAHEALIEAWPRLSSWIDDDRQGLRVHRHLTTAASSWGEVGRDDGELYRGARLSTALSWIGEAAPDLSHMERDFIAASVDISDKQLRTQQRANRRLRVLVVLSVMAVIVAAIGTVVAIRAARDAERGRAEAEAARLVDIIRGDSNLSGSAVLQLAVSADRLASTPTTRGLLLDALVVAGYMADGQVMNESRLVSHDEIDARPIGDAPISATGGVVLAQDNNVFGVIFDAETLEPVERKIRPSPNAVTGIGGRVLGLQGAGRSGSTKLEVVDLHTGDLLGPPQSLTAEASKVALSPDGMSLAIASAESGTTEQGVTILDVVSGRVRTKLASEHAGSIRTVTFSPDGRYVLATLDASGALAWDTTTRTVIFDTPAGGGDIGRLAMSPSNTLLAVGRGNGQVELWALAADGSGWRELDTRSSHSDRVTWIDFDAQSSRVVTTSADGQVIIWNAGTGDIVEGPLRFDAAGGITYFRRGSTTRLVTIDSQGGTWEWDLQRDKVLESVSGVNFGASARSLPGTRVFVTSGSGVMVHDPAGSDPVEIRFDSDDGPAKGVLASGDGSRIVVVRDDGRVELRDAKSGAIVTEFEEPMDAADTTSIAVDRHGARVAYQQGGRDVVIADADGSWRHIELELSRRRLQTLALSPNGDELVLSTTSGEAIWYDLDGTVSTVIAPQSQGFDAQFLDDGRVAVVGAEGAQVIDPRRPESSERIALPADVRRLAIDPTGRLLATVDADGAVQLWDGEDRVTIGDPVPFDRELPPIAIRFSADGRYLVASGTRQTSWINVSSEDWAHEACTLVDAQLRSEEVARILGAVEVADACA